MRVCMEVVGAGDDDNESPLNGTHSGAAKPVPAHQDNE